MGYEYFSKISKWLLLSMLMAIHSFHTSNFSFGDICFLKKLSMYNPLISNLCEQWDRVSKCLNKYSWQLKEGKNTAFSTLSGQTKTDKSHTLHVETEDWRSKNEMLYKAQVSHHWIRSLLAAHEKGVAKTADTEIFCFCQGYKHLSPEDG